MASIKERAAALHLAEKLCVRPTCGQVVKPMNSCLLWSSLIADLKSSVTVKRRRVHIKAHSDCFLGSEAVDVVAEHLKLSKKFEAVDVTREKVICVCQALLDCSVFEVPGTRTSGKGKKPVFQDSKSSLYRFMSGHIPSVDELERGVLSVGIQAFFCSEKSEEQTGPSSSHVEMMVSSEMNGLTLASSLDSPVRSRTEGTLPQTLVDEVWQELTLLRLLTLVEIPVLEGILQCSPTQRTPQKTFHLPHTNRELDHSSRRLDRKALQAFRDSQVDEWLCAGLDCLDFLPDQVVLDVSRRLPLGFSDVEAQRPQYEQPLLSSTFLDDLKVLVYGVLSKYYSHMDHSPLLPPHMTDIYNAITDLLVTARLGAALEAVQLSLKLLEPRVREELQRLLTFMALAAEPQAVRLDTEELHGNAQGRGFRLVKVSCFCSNSNKLLFEGQKQSKQMENRLAVKRSFFRAVLHTKDLTKEKEDLMVIFMLSNIQEIFKIPGALHKEVSEKLAMLVRGQKTDVTPSTFCRQIPRRTYTRSTKTTTNHELWKLLDGINGNMQISSKERKRLLGQFSQAHPEVFNQYFGDSAASVVLKL